MLEAHGQETRVMDARTCDFCDRSIADREATWLLPDANGRGLTRCKTCTREAHPEWFGTGNVSRVAWGVLASVVIALGIIFTLTSFQP
jgi:hypothetical protein